MNGTKIYDKGCTSFFLFLVLFFKFSYDTKHSYVRNIVMMRNVIIRNVTIRNVTIQNLK